MPRHRLHALPVIGLKPGHLRVSAPAVSDLYRHPRCSRRDTDLDITSSTEPWHRRAGGAHRTRRRTGSAGGIARVPHRDRTVTTRPASRLVAFANARRSRRSTLLRSSHRPGRRDRTRGKGIARGSPAVQGANRNRQGALPPYAPTAATGVPWPLCPATDPAAELKVGLAAPRIAFLRLGVAVRASVLPSRQ